MANNSSGENSTWQQLLAKHGPWAFGCGVLGFVVYAFVLVPGNHEREAFVQTAVSNAESMHSIATSTKDIKESVVRQESVMKELKKEVEYQSNLRETAMKTMTDFADGVRKEHPKQLELLQKIDENLKPHQP